VCPDGLLAWAGCGTSFVVSVPAQYPFAMPCWRVFVNGFIFQGTAAELCKLTVQH